MGCSTSSHHGSSLGSAVGRNKLELSDADKKAIRRTWKLMQNDMIGIGAKIFLRIFTLQPDVKNIFPCRDLVGEELLKDPHFKGHASRFMQAVGAVVDNIDVVEETMTPLLLKLGEQHTHFTGFRVEYFEVFTEAIRQIWRQELLERFRRDVEDAWMLVFMYIMTTLKDGYTGSTTGRPSMAGPFADRSVAL